MVRQKLNSNVIAKLAIVGTVAHIVKKKLTHLVGIPKFRSRFDKAFLNAAEAFRANGILISYRRGHITVLDRPGMESRACECYNVVKKEFHRLLCDAEPK